MTKVRDPLVDRECARLDGRCGCAVGSCRKYPVREPIFRKHLPPEVSSDWHQIIAKALHARLMLALYYGLAKKPEIRFTRDELERAMEAEFEYGYDPDSGAMIFRPVADTSIPGERK